MNVSLAGSERVRCRHPKCRSKLTTPTSNDHHAFCTPDCYRRFYKRRCLVCEKSLPEGYRRQLCLGKECARNWRNFRPTYTFKLPPGLECTGDSKSPCAAGGKRALKDLRAPSSARVIAGPPLSDFSLWAATLDPPPYRPMVGWVSVPPPGTLAAEWTARELARREADDARYVAEDEERLRTAPVDSSGNYAPYKRVEGAAP
jgi:hypothetical protein